MSNNLDVANLLHLLCYRSNLFCPFQTHNGGLYPRTLKLNNLLLGRSRILDHFTIQIESWHSNIWLTLYIKFCELSFITRVIPKFITNRFSNRTNAYNDPWIQGHPQSHIFYSKLPNQVHCPTEADARVQTICERDILRFNFIHLNARIRNERGENILNV